MRFLSVLWFAAVTFFGPAAIVPFFNNTELSNEPGSSISVVQHVLSSAPTRKVKHCSIILSHQEETYCEILVQGNITDGLGAV
jgi:hypothetical protein